MNKVILMGNMTRDPEIKETGSGTTVCNFGIALNEKYKDKEKTHFVECTAFASTAEIIEKYFSKGSRILLAGKLDFQSWETDDGSKRSKLGVIVTDFEFVDKKKSSDASEENSDSEESQVDDVPSDSDDDEDAPF